MLNGAFGGALRLGYRDFMLGSIGYLHMPNAYCLSENFRYPERHATGVPFAAFDGRPTFMHRLLWDGNLEIATLGHFELTLALPFDLSPQYSYGDYLPLGGGFQDGLFWGLTSLHSTISHRFMQNIGPSIQTYQAYTTNLPLDLIGHYLLTGGGLLGKDFPINRSIEAGILFNGPNETFFNLQAYTYLGPVVSNRHGENMRAKRYGIFSEPMFSVSTCLPIGSFGSISGNLVGRVSKKPLDEAALAINLGPFSLSTSWKDITGSGFSPRFAASMTINLHRR
ncbi:MAG: hypothetical protein JW841_08480 [Deltaproteobacteria bacterium]|nr:hypothetical protein [Deltaproteobacteria bacterium]